MKIYDLLWKRTEDKNGKARWEKVGVLMDKDDGKKSVKIDLMPAGSWDGWLVVAERKPKEMNIEQQSAPVDEGDIPF
jgi:hypothetical protein